MRRTGRTERTDAGFTLPEILVTIVVTSVIVGAIGVAFTTFLRNEDYSRNQVGGTRDAFSLATWLPPDVQSTAASGGIDTTPTTATGCAGSPAYVAGANRNVLRLTWSDTSTTPATVYRAAYRAEVAGGQWSLRRYSCTDNGTPTVLRVVRYLQGENAAVVVDTASRLGLRVTTDVEGVVTTVEVTGSRRTPSVTSTTSPPPTSPPTSRPPN
jgi:prepilin-type N-terminal cleavage/methylation domain-containing protein